MNLATAIVLALVAAALVAAVVACVRKRRRGLPLSCGNCAGCALKGVCQK